MDPWIAARATAIAARAERELEALVGVSTPSGDVRGAQEAAAIAAALLPDGAEVEHVPCSSPGHAPDLVARLRGTGRGRILLLGHLDTVVAHDGHRPLEPDPDDADRLFGSGTVDMKGGDVLALGVMRALAAEPERFAEIALLLVVDEEWRVGPFAHVERFAGFDACLCFEAGELTTGGEDAVVVKRKAAGTVEVLAQGRSAHSGSAPDRGVNALLALAEAARAIAGCHDPRGPERLTAVPTVLHSGDAFNVVPAEGRLIADVRADRLEAFAAVLAAVPAQVGGATLTTRLAREWPGMDARAATGPLLEQAGALLGRRVAGAARGGASDASHFASAIPLTVDGLGPRGGAAHNPGEFVRVSSLRTRAEVALAVALAALDPGNGA
ncbi:M20 family metallopeptidase [Baekduia soli]|uniref:M20 family metallopeptidase n=1 Tax=Baekduia soli TaxID=496014 RepID=A0A5B8U3R3_9ACTN|nr:M20/M25/M40 family metallo-hydrolase [Baekduia soli]QEC47630.1 M20 family metallopeptidase [Baekduia soli]